MTTSKERRITLSFVTVGIIGSLVLILFGVAIVQNRHVAAQNSRLIEDFRKFRVQRAKETTAADARLCNKVDKLDAALISIVVGSAKAPKPGQYGYAYFKAHPEEANARGRLKGQTAQAVTKLRQAACDPRNLPTAKAGP